MSRKPGMEKSHTIILKTMITNIWMSSMIVNQIGGATGHCLLTTKLTTKRMTHEYLNASSMHLINRNLFTSFFFISRESEHSVSSNSHVFKKIYWYGQKKLKCSMDNNLVTVRKISQVIILEFLLCYEKKEKNPIPFLCINPFIASPMENNEIYY